jgi:hypothetical protein
MLSELEPGFREHTNARADKHSNENIWHSVALLIDIKCR